MAILLLNNGMTATEALDALDEKDRIIAALSVEYTKLRTLVLEEWDGPPQYEYTPTAEELIKQAKEGK